MRMNGNAAMVEGMTEIEPDDDLYRFERDMRLTERCDDMLAALKHLLRVVAEPVSAEIDGGRVRLLIGHDDLRHLITRSRTIVDFVDSGRDA
jgi:hypothetical protein